MTPKDPTQDVPGDIFPATALSVATIALDRDTQRLLKLWMGSMPVTAHVELGEYPDEHGSVQDWAGESAVDICLLDFDKNPNLAFSVAEQIHQDSPETAIFAVSGDAQPDVIIQAMRSGCREYLQKPLVREQLLQSLARVSGRRRERKEKSTAQVLTFIGAKGGCGVTTLATQLGALLASSKKTLLLDLHFNLGDAALYLGFATYRYHSFELIDNTDRVDAELLQSLVLHHSSGLDILPSPNDFDSSRHISPAAIAQSFSLLRQRYDFIIVDLPPGLTDAVVKLIGHSDYFYVVTVAEVSALRNVARIVDYLAQENISQDRARVILNRFEKGAPISEGQIEKVIRRKIFWAVPNEYHQAVKTITAGDATPQLSKSELLRNISGWAEAIRGKPATEDKGGKKKRGLLGLFGD